MITNDKKTQCLRWLEIDLSKIEHNIKEFQQLLGDTNIGVVVKSNAYGHGLLEIAKTAVKAGVSCLFAVSIEEALQLRENGIKIPVVIIGYVPEWSITMAAKNNISVALYSFNQAEAYEKELAEARLKIKVHVKIDTGIGRLGILPNDSLSFFQKVEKFKYIEIEGMYSHFADAETPEIPYTNKQVKLFYSVLNKLKAAGLEPPIKHMAGSAASLMVPKSRFNLIRLGISTYGLWPSKETEIASRYKNKLKKVKLLPAMSYMTRIVQIKILPLGYSVGYGCTYKTPRPTRIGVIPVGYADGYDRHLSNLGRVIVKGKFAPIVGIICMNMCMVDLTDIPEAKEYDEVVLFGEQNGEMIKVEELADKIGTINYEVTTRIPESVKRIFIY